MEGKETIHTLSQIRGHEREQIFLSSPGDSDLEVQKRAVWCLGMIKSIKGLEKMMGILKQVSAAPSPKMDLLETQIYHAFGNSGSVTIEGKTLEQFLLQVVEQRGIKRWWGLFEKTPLTDAAFGTICDAFGKIGTKDSIKALAPLEKSREGPRIPKLKEALKKIEERIGMTAKSQAPNHK